MKEKTKYEYLPPSTNTQNSGTYNDSGDLEHECELKNNFLKANNASAYCDLK